VSHLGAWNLLDLGDTRDVGEGGSERLAVSAEVEVVGVALFDAAVDVGRVELEVEEVVVSGENLHVAASIASLRVDPLLGLAVVAGSDHCGVRVGDGATGGGALLRVELDGEESDDEDDSDDRGDGDELLELGAHGVTP
jgi:hypothetical protein